jgi:DNA-binding NarL/FixJ family response regulator
MEVLSQNTLRPRILIAEDHLIFAETLSAYLGRTFAVVGIVGDGHSMVEEAITLNPNLVLADVSLPMLNGLDAAKRIQKSAPSVKFVFLTMHNDPILAAAAMELGHVGFVLKNSGGKELLEAIEQVLHGQSYLTPKLRAADWVEAKDRVRQFTKELTKRQQDIVQLLAEGRAQKEIASILNVNVKTVGFHKFQVMHTFNIKNNAELVIFAAKRGLISSHLGAMARGYLGQMPVPKTKRKADLALWKSENAQGQAALRG